jgi:DNA-binding transcriptional regulator of glucitol operon
VAGPELPPRDVGKQLRTEQLAKTMRKAAGALLAVAIIQTIFGPVALWLAKSQLERENPGMVFQIKPIGYVIVWGLAAVFYALYFWARSSPFPAAIVGLVLFVSAHVAAAIADPTTLAKGWLVKIIVVVVLAQAISAGAQHRRIMSESRMA